MFISAAAALGVAPGSFDLPYSESQQLDFIIINTGDQPVDVSLAAEGELRDSITLSEQAIHMAPHEEHTSHAVLSLSSLAPGKHTAQLMIREVAQDETSTVTAVAGVISRIVVNVPYPSKYAEAELVANNHSFVVKVWNRGSEPFQASARISVKGNGMDIAALDSDTKPVMPSGWRELVAGHGLVKGHYDADAVIFYDDNRTAAKLDFRLGQPDMLVFGQTEESSVSICSRPWGMTVSQPRAARLRSSQGRVLTLTSTGQRSTRCRVH
jgi:hypothetical protein